jgi:hypothetical protein
MQERRELAKADLVTTDLGQGALSLIAKVEVSYKIFDAGRLAACLHCALSL